MGERQTAPKRHPCQIFGRGGAVKPQSHEVARPCFRARGLTGPTAAEAQSDVPSDAERNRQPCLRTTVSYVPGLYNKPGHRSWHSAATDGRDKPRP